MIMFTLQLPPTKLSGALLGSKEVFDVLSNTGRISISFPELSPGRGKKSSTLFVFEDHMDFINEKVGSFAFPPVLVDPVDHRIGNDQKAHGL